ncbi:MBL fold metallo-hydrolase [Deinococcus sedimenti]|uniref:Zn-dependent hydrolase n=1 Tax=Deinococcus sedimenti TaxID=1867090 RepID=A0ABQ2S8J4_9DEIO|nr:MBL fold metallo-hydrolase [Deinococcus sedimenti]GGS01464.1 Zn-dependent hydrolase [Deinococcus sedimenti]
MLFERFYNADLAQASYLIGCQKTGESLVIDPVRDVQPYLDRAAQSGLRVTHVTETHIHADYLSGSRELAARTGARLLLPAQGGPDWTYDLPADPLRHGQTITIGNLRVEVRHTPGHTPESVSFLVTDPPRGDQPALYLTGDFVFVGDVGRPDLLDEAAGGVDTRFTGARQMFASLRDEFLTLPDGVQVWPGHGAGSACGKALGTVPTTTVGYERALAWWAPYVADGDEAGFTAQLLSGQPDAPQYYGRMKRHNRAGPPLLGDVTPLPHLSPADLNAQVTAGHVLIDSRPKEEHHAGAPRGSVNLPDGRTFETWAGWLLRPDVPGFILLARDAAHAETLRRRLWMVGLDHVTGFVTAADGLSSAPARPFPVAELPQHAGALILDVRSRAEHAAGAVPGAQHLPASRLAGHLGQLPHDQEIVVYCQGGARSAAAASLLRAHGLRVSELAGGFDAYQREHSARTV